jgi:hypothetical protein
MRRMGNLTPVLECTQVTATRNPRCTGPTSLSTDFLEAVAGFLVQRDLLGLAPCARRGSGHVE